MQDPFSDSGERLTVTVVEQEDEEVEVLCTPQEEVEEGLEVSRV